MTESPRFIEQHEGDRPELITAETLLKDNTSLEANNRRLAWDTNRNHRKLKAISMCGDARGTLPNPTKAIVIRSIAATTGNPELFAKLIADPGSDGVINMGHFDGQTVMKGKKPHGCGGLGAKEAQIANGTPRDLAEGIAAYVGEQISHTDVAVQTTQTALQMSRLAGEKSVAAFIQDHLTGTIAPIAIFSNRGENQFMLPALKNALEGEYDEERLYDNGLPTIPNGYLPEQWQQYIEEYQQQLARYHNEYPTLPMINKVQSPSLFHLSTTLRPFETKFPLLGDKPNTVFKLHLPRYRDQLGKEVFDPSAIELVVKQESQYPIEHFKDMKTTFIETAYMDTSLSIARVFRQQPWAADWEKQGGKIIIAQTKDGNIKDIDQLK